MLCRFRRRGKPRSACCASFAAPVDGRYLRCVPSVSHAPCNAGTDSLHRADRHRMLSRFTLLTAVALLAAVPAAAQPDTIPRPLIVPDTLADRVVTDAVPADSVRPLSPRGAFFRSLVLPGWGQSELGLPLRGGVYFALEASSLWMVYKTGEKLGEARERQRVARQTGEIAPDAKHPLVRDRENQYEDWITLSIFWLFFSGADAFVAAHLQDFDVHVNAVPRPEGGMELRATVPVP